MVMRDFSGRSDARGPWSESNRIAPYQAQMSLNNSSQRIDDARGQRHSAAVTSDHTHRPRVLIADDDPISLRFLAAAIAELGCESIAVADGRSALAAVQVHQFDLLLLDRRMPDLGGAELLAALRAQDNATPAVATSAEVDAEIIAQLRHAGFVDIVEKPVTLAQLQHIVGLHLHFSARPETAAVAFKPAANLLLDDVTALAAIGGDATALGALRGLLAQEIATLSARLAQFDLLTGAAALRDHLHRLRASCGFCGAMALAEAAARLDQCLRDRADGAPGVLADFLDHCQATQVALRAQVPAAAGGARTSPSMPQARKPAPSR
jgi:CheY-like chemotaxis protein